MNITRMLTTFKSTLQRLDLRLALLLFSSVLVIAIWTSTFHQLEINRAGRITDAQRDATSLSRLFLEHARRTIESADQAAVYLRYRYIEAGSRLNLINEIHSGLLANDVFNLFTVVDSRGDVVLSSKAFTPVNLADREHIRVHMQGNEDSLFVSRPVLGRVSQRWSLQLTRRISQGNDFKGVIVVSMDPQHFTSLYHQIDVGLYGSVALVGEDGIIRVRRTGNSDAMGEDVGRGSLFREMITHRDGVTTAVSLVDGRSRLYSYSHLPGYPFFSVVGIDLDERLAPFNEERSRMLAVSGAVSIAILLFNIVMVWLAASLVKSRRDALVANETKSRFLSNMSHELRTPLNGILGYADALKDDPHSYLAPQFAEEIHKSGLRLLSTVSAILDITNLDDHKVELCLNEENPRELIMQAVSRHTIDAAAKGLQLDFNVAESVPKIIRCDGFKVVKILDNLLSNAIRFTDKGRIFASMRATSATIVIEISDSGIGVPESERERIFEKFAQVSDAPNRASDGTGLGLTIARRLAILMGGSLNLESPLIGGSTFVFCFPRVSPVIDDEINQF